MKWCLKMILVFIGSLPIFRCGQNKGKEGKVTFNGKEINDKTFIVLNKAFAKNNSNVYYKSYSLPDADVKTFTALDKHYAKDNKNVFYCDEEREGQNYYLTKHSVIFKLKGAQPSTFTILGEGYEGYAKDSNRAYCKGIGFDVKDVASLTILTGRFVKDKYQVYFELTPVKGAQANSFRTLTDCYACDANHVYYYGYHNELYNGIHPIPCDAASFNILEYPYSKDKESAYYVYEKIKASDAESFAVVGNDFAKDKNHVYIKAKILGGADATTFTIVPHDENTLDEFNYSKDKNQVFWKDQKLTEANSAEFKSLGLDYATDGKHIYYQAKLVKTANPSTFVIYDHGYGDADAEDSTNKYSKGVRVVIEN